MRTALTVALLAIPLCARAQVKVAPYYTPAVGSNALTTAATTDTSVDVLVSGSMVRTLMPFAGLVYQISFPIGAVTPTAFYVSKATCSSMAANACTVFTAAYAQTITGPFTSNALNTFTLAVPLAVSKWDALAFRIEFSQPHTINLSLFTAQPIAVVSGNGTPTLAEAAYYQLNVAKPSTFTLSGMTAIPANAIPEFGAYMAPPQMLGIGNSIMGSAPAPSDSVADSFAQDYPIPAVYSPLHFWANSFPVAPTYQSMGWSGQTLVQEQTRMTSDTLALQPGGYLLIEGGINDINNCSVTTGCTGPQITAIENALASMMSAGQSAGARTFVMLAGPDLQSQSGSNARMTSEDTINANTISVAPGYGATVIDWRCTLGQFRAGQRAGNCWDWQAAYMYGDGLGVHPNQAGVQLVGNLIYAASPYAPSNSKPGGGSSAGGSSGGIF
jgi:hypothetical protein